MTLDSFGLSTDPGPAAEAILATAEAYVRRHGTITADDLNELTPHYQGDRRVFGAILATLRKRGIIAPAGYIKSERNNARPIVKWVLTAQNP